MEVKKSTFLSHLAYESFDSKFSGGYFSKVIIIKAFFIALCLSLFIYLDYFSVHVKIFDTLLALIGFYLLLTCERQTFTWVGFFIGIFWFYWISFSFRYYDLNTLIPFVILGVGLIYMLIFFFIGLLSTSSIIRALLIFSLSFIAPFGFNWFKPELIFINSYFSTNLYLFALFIFIMALKIQWFWKLLGFAILMGFPLLTSPKNNDLPALHVALTSLNLDQKKKWDKAYRQEIIEGNFYLIEQAIENKKNLIILPESAFPLYLNLEKETLHRLEILSKKISILTGALHVQNNRVFNSSYLFKDGKYEIANKVILVPFGEEIPLPKFAKDFINKTFFNGADDYKSADNVHDFKISGYTFRNAICFEATKDKLFEANPNYMIAISNNAWFTPSIEPTLQNLLLKLYARKHNTIIYHSANSGKSEIIKP